MFQCGRDESQSLLILLHAFRHVVQILTHFSHHHRLFVQLFHVILFYVQLGKLIATALVINETLIRTAKHGKYDRVRRGHIAQCGQIVRRGGELHNRTNGFGKFAQLVKVHKSIDVRVTLLLGAIQVLLAKREEGYDGRRGRLGLDQMTILVHVERRIHELFQLVKQPLVLGGHFVKK